MSFATSTCQQPLCKTHSDYFALVCLEGLRLGGVKDEVRAGLKPCARINAGRHLAPFAHLSLVLCISKWGLASLVVWAVFVAFLKNFEAKLAPLFHSNPCTV